MGGKLVLHSQLFGDDTPTRTKRALEVTTLIDEALRAKGVETLYTWAETDEQYRFNQFMGFKPTGSEVQFEYEYPNRVYEFSKVL